MLFRTKKRAHLQQSISLKVQKKKFDVVLVLLVLILAFFGLIMIFDASVVAAARDFSDKYYFVREQGTFLVLGIVLMLIVSLINYHYWFVYADLLIIGIIVLLIAVFIPGVGIHALGANRWVNFRVFILQPAELAKLIFIIYLSSFFTTRKKNILLPFIGSVLLITSLIILEPDLGTTVIVLCISGALYFLSGAPLKHLLGLIPFGIVGTGILAVVSPYRFKRVLAFFNPNIDPLGISSGAFCAILKMR